MSDWESDKIVCPQCGAEITDDLFEFKNNGTYRCDECEMDFDLEIEYTAHYRATPSEPDSPTQTANPTEGTE